MVVQAPGTTTASCSFAVVVCRTTPPSMIFRLMSRPTACKSSAIISAILPDCSRELSQVSRLICSGSPSSRLRKPSSPTGNPISSNIALVLSGSYSM